MLENNNKKVSKINIRSSDLYSRHINQRVFRIQKQIYHYSLENRSKVDIHRKKLRVQYHPTMEIQSIGCFV